MYLNQTGYMSSLHDKKYENTEKCPNSKVNETLTVLSRQISAEDGWVNVGVLDVNAIWIAQS